MTTTAVLGRLRLHRSTNAEARNQGRRVPYLSRLPRMPRRRSFMLLPDRLRNHRTASRLRLPQPGVCFEEGRRMSKLDWFLWALIAPFAHAEDKARRVGHWIAERALDRHVTRLSRLISEDDDQ